MRPREDREHLAREVGPLRIGPGHVPDQSAARAVVAVEQQRQVAGDEAVIAVRDKGSERVSAYEFAEAGSRRAPRRRKGRT